LMVCYSVWNTKVQLKKENRNLKRKKKDPSFQAASQCGKSNRAWTGSHASLSSLLVWAITPPYGVTNPTIHHDSETATTTNWKLSAAVVSQSGLHPIGSLFNFTAHTALLLKRFPGKTSPSARQPMQGPRQFTDLHRQLLQTPRKSLSPTEPAGLPRQEDREPRVAIPYLRYLVFCS